MVGVVSDVMTGNWKIVDKSIVHGTSFTSPVRLPVIVPDCKRNTGRFHNAVLHVDIAVHRHLRCAVDQRQVDVIEHVRRRARYLDRIDHALQVEPLHIDAARRAAPAWRPPAKPTTDN